MQYNFVLQHAVQFFTAICCTVLRYTLEYGFVLQVRVQYVIHLCSSFCAALVQCSSVLLRVALRCTTCHGASWCTAERGGMRYSKAAGSHLTSLKLTKRVGNGGCTSSDYYT